MLTVPETARNIPIMIKWDEVDPMKEIETLNKNGNVYILGLDKIYFTSELENMSEEVISQKIGTSIMQFFVRYLDGSNTAPICFYSIVKSESFYEFMKEKLDFIIPGLESGGKLKIWATCSDGDSENEKVVTYLSNNYPLIRHL
jgi:hypothetical protein